VEVAVGAAPLEAAEKEAAAAAAAVIGLVLGLQVAEQVLSLNWHSRFQQTIP
jgi:hypothetical protein